MTAAPVSPSEAREAAAVLGALLASLPPATTARERRVREATRAAQRALIKSGSEDRAQEAVSRYYRRQS